MTSERWILIVAVLAALKQTCDITQELIHEYNAVDQQASDLRATRKCETLNGTPLGILERGDHNELTCAVPRAPSR